MLFSAAKSRGGSSPGRRVPTVRGAPFGFRCRQLHDPIRAVRAGDPAFVDNQPVDPALPRSPTGWPSRGLERTTPPSRLHGRRAAEPSPRPDAAVRRAQPQRPAHPRAEIRDVRNWYSTIWLAWAVREAGRPVTPHLSGRPAVRRMPTKTCAGRAFAPCPTWSAARRLEALARACRRAFDCVFFDADRVTPRPARAAAAQADPDVLLLADNALSHPDEISVLPVRGGPRLCQASR